MGLLGLFSPYNFAHNEPRLFVNSQWPCIPQWLYLVWRVLVAIYSVLLTVYYVHQKMVTGEPIGKYLSHWSFYFFIAAMMAHFAIVAHSYHRRRQGLSDPLVMPWYYKMTWLLWNTGINGTIHVTVCFWYYYWFRRYKFAWLVYHTHGISLGVLALDFCISGLPVRIQHASCGLTLGIVYSIFNYIYEMHKNKGVKNMKYWKYIYAVVSWKNSRQTLKMTAIILFVYVLNWIGVYILFRIRTFISNCCCQRKRQVDTIQVNKIMTDINNNKLSIL